MAETHSNSFSLRVTTGGPSGGPAWFAAANALEWLNPVVGTVSQVADPLGGTTNFGNGGGVHASNAQGITAAWQGMFTDEVNRTIGTLANGGHQDYFGNEVYSLDLGADSPAWVRNRNATPRDNTGECYLNLWSDGRTVAHHAIHNTVAGNGRWFLPMRWALNTCGGSSANPVLEFDHTGTAANRIDSTPGVADWINWGDHHNPGNIQASLQCCVYDPINNEIIRLHGGNGNGVASFISLNDMSSDALVVPGYFSPANLSASVDTLNHVLLLHGEDYDWGSETYFEVWYQMSLKTTASKNAGFQFLAHTTGKSTRRSMGWHQASGAFLTWGGDNTIRKIVPSVGADDLYTGLSESTVAVTSGAGTPVESGISGGLYNRVSVINDMGNGDGLFCVALYNHSAESRFCKLPAGGI